MPARRIRGWSYFACLWLSLATIFAHAVLPTGSPIARGQGSAFSVSTTDVSLAPKRRDTVRKDKLQARAPGPDSAGAGASSTIAPAVLPAVGAPAARFASASDHRAAPVAGLPAGRRAANRARAPPAA